MLQDVHPTGPALSTASKGVLKLREHRWNDVFSSEEEGLEKCHIQIRNEYSGTLLVCWVDAHGKLHHYYPVNGGSISDGSVSNKHLEYTNVGNSFSNARTRTRAQPVDLTYVLIGLNLLL